MNTRIRKISITVVAVALVAVFSYNLLDVRTTALADENKEAALKIVDVLTDSLGDTIVKPIDASEYEKDLNEDVLAFENKNYEILFTKDGHNIKAIIPISLPDTPMFDKITSEAAATQTAESFIKKASPDFFVSDYYDVICSKSGEEGHESYTVELWEKISDGFYTGNKIAVILTEDGQLMSYIARDSGSEQAVQNLLKGTLADATKITESEAITLAYTKLKKKVENLEQEEQPSSNSSVKTGDDVILSDSGKIVNEQETSNVTEKYKIDLADTKNHTVEAYRELKQGQVQWIIKISNIKTNRDWNMAFVVVVNAQTGDIDSINYTR